MINGSSVMARRGAPRPRLSPHSRLVLVERVLAGQSPTAVAAQLGCSRQTVHKWVKRYEAEGAAGLEDRSSRPARSPARTPAGVEKRICALRRRRRWGPARIGAALGIEGSTVHRVLCRHGLNRLGWIDRPTGQLVRRYEKAHAGELVHIDVKKVAKVPPGGGWRIHGRGSAKAKRKHKRRGYTFLHVAVDDHSRIAYVEAHDDEKADTAAAFWRRARGWFDKLNVGIDAVMTDNAKNFTSNAFTEALAENRTQHRLTRPYRPQTNGKVERFNRTMSDEFLYSYKFRSEPDRRRLQNWVHTYNLHRHHTAIAGTPASRVNNLCGHYTVAAGNTGRVNTSREGYWHRSSSELNTTTGRQHETEEAPTPNAGTTTPTRRSIAGLVGKRRSGGAVRLDDRTGRHTSPTAVTELGQT